MDERYSDVGVPVEGVTKSPEAEPLEVSSERSLEEGVAGARRLPLRAQQSEEYLDLLVRTVGEMGTEGAVTTAAAVSLRMRSALPGFTPQAAGYNTFKAFLQAAQAKGRVSLAPVGTVGNGDILVGLPLDARSLAALPDESSRRWVAQAVWHAVLSSEPAFLDRQSGQLVASSLLSPSEDLVELPTVSAAQFSGWIQEFAATQSEPARSTLAAWDPTHAKDQLRKFAPSVRRGWYRFLRGRVAEMLEGWAAQSGVDERLVFAPPPAPWTPVQTASAGGHRPASRESSYSSPSSADASVEDLRRIVIRAVSEMSRAELLRLPIPLEYLLR